MSRRSIEPLAPSGAPAARAEPAEDASATELWRAVLVRYDDESLHDAFIRRAHAEGKLRFALDSYRRYEQLRPGDPTAKRNMLKIAKAMEVSALGTTTSIALGTHERRMSRATRAIAMLVLGLLAMLGVYVALELMRQSAG